MMTAPARPQQGATTRLAGIDAARALAFAGMLLAHFAASFHPSDPGWLQAVDNAADGRATPLFCLLLGVGAGLLASVGTPDLAFVKRGLVLFALGLLVWPFVESVYLILPHYGILLALFPLVRRVPTRWLLPVAGLFFLLPSLVVATVGDAGLRSAGQPSGYGDLVDIGSVLGQILWTGGYPLVGWTGFVLVGAWVVRRPLGHPVTQRRLLFGSAAVAVTQPLLAAGHAGFDGLAFLDGTAHSNQTAWYVLAAATSVAMIAGWLIVARRATVAIRPLVPLGQLALSAYLVHLLLGETVVFPWLDRNVPPIGAQVTVVVAVFAASATAAAWWRSRHRRGPVETVVRALAR
jgi:uncharacterized membrane protein YeiB